MAVITCKMCGGVTAYTTSDHQITATFMVRTDGGAAYRLDPETGQAANAAFDRLTGGYSSRIQLDSLIANALLALRLTGGAM